MFCEKCGNELQKEAKFCSKCGNPVKTEKETITNPLTEKDIGENLEIYKKIILISLIISGISFAVVGITSGMADNPAVNIIWNFTKVIFFISLFIYCMSMIGITIFAIKNKQKLKGWIGTLQTITLAIAIVAIVIGTSSYVSNKSREKTMRRVQQEMSQGGYSSNNSNTNSNKTSNSSNEDNLDINNPSSIRNGEIAFRKYAQDMNLIVKNLSVQYLETDGKGRYAFKGTVAVSFKTMESYSQTETWYIVLDINTKKYEGAYSLEGAKFASGWDEI